jgi:cytochrome c oxidase assembly protein subunit 15
MKKGIILLTVILSYVLLVFGSAVAAYGACLGCPDWPLCYGSFLPPEQVGAILEYVHRAIAAITSGFVFSTAFITHKDFRGSFLSRAGWLLALTVFIQIFVGGLTVILKMPFWVSITHAFLGLSTFVLALFILKKFNSRSFSINFRSSTFWIFTLLFLQVLLGTSVRKANAGFACGQDLFLCLNVQWDGDVLLHLSHRLFGFFILIFALLSLFDKENWKINALLFLLILLIITFGLLSVYSLLSPTMVSMHYALTLLAIGLSFWRSVN